MSYERNSDEATGKEISVYSEKASEVERIVMLPEGWFPDGSERPMRKAVVLTEDNGWARIKYLDDGTVQTVTTIAFRPVT
ncbi:hypothetical protein [Thalassolituus sp.]|uniref:hypothetical protein n=1 Tax=Thalassolituus sp. TaxID=2030822 RepID=UPI00262B6591|nr:hypothetical protein [Thalassolituus sp.]